MNFRQHKEKLLKNLRFFGALRSEKMAPSGQLKREGERLYCSTHDYR
jgi:hypothetical protein